MTALKQDCGFFPTLFFEFPPNNSVPWKPVFISEFDLNYQSFTL